MIIFLDIGTLFLKIFEFNKINISQKEFINFKFTKKILIYFSKNLLILIPICKKPSLELIK